MSKKTIQAMLSTRKFIVNALYFVAVFAFAFMLATQALMHKINNYELNKNLFFLTVKKERVDVSSTVSGRVVEIFVRAGAHVSEGDALIRIQDEGLELKIEALETVARDNLSARTELELIRARSGEYQIRAPRDGVVEEIHAVKGTSIIEGSLAASIYADDNLQLVGSIKPDQYNLIDKHRDVMIFNPRLGQAYTASFQGITGVRDDILSADGQPVQQQAQNDNQTKTELYEIRFALNEEEEGSSFIEGERLEIVPENAEVEHLKPLYRLANLWNSLILGTDFESLRKYNEQDNDNPISGE